MAHLDIFNDDAFSVVALTDAVNAMEVAESPLADEGLFEEKGISTTILSVEKKGNTLQLVSAKERGGVGQTGKKSRRDMVHFDLVHLPQNDQILADEVQNVRAFGSESELEQMQGKVNERLDTLKQNNDATIEFQRMGAIKGKIIDADGSTVIENLYTKFGVSQPTQNMALSTEATKVRNLLVQSTRQIKKNCPGATIKAFKCKCSTAFFDLLIEHPEVAARYERWLDGAALRGNVDSGFVYADIEFEVYDVSVDGKDYITSGEAYLYPVGVKGMFVTRFGPADYMEYVNTPGLPYYASIERLPHGKGVDIDAQSNTISINTRPKGVFKLTAS